MIRISDPARLGQTLGTLRITAGWGRRELARHLATTHGTEGTNNLNLWSWDTGRRQPALDSLGHYLAALGYDLALVPREDTP
jgi:hypothetical protein